MANRNGRGIVPDRHAVLAHPAVAARICRPYGYEGRAEWEIYHLARCKESGDSAHGNLDGDLIRICARIAHDGQWKGIFRRANARICSDGDVGRTRQVWWRVVHNQDFLYAGHRDAGAPIDDFPGPQHFIGPVAHRHLLVDIPDHILAGMPDRHSLERGFSRHGRVDVWVLARDADVRREHDLTDGRLLQVQDVRAGGTIARLIRGRPGDGDLL